MNELSGLRLLQQDFRRYRKWLLIPAAAIAAVIVLLWPAPKDAAIEAMLAEVMRSIAPLSPPQRTTIDLPALPEDESLAIVLQYKTKDEPSAIPALRGQAEWRSYNLTSDLAVLHLKGNKVIGQTTTRPCRFWIENSMVISSSQKRLTLQCEPPFESCTSSGRGLKNCIVSIVSLD